MEKLRFRAVPTVPEETVANTFYFDLKDGVFDMSFSGPDKTMYPVANKEFILSLIASSLPSAGTAVRGLYNAGATINGGKNVILAADGMIYPMDILDPDHYLRWLGVAETAGGTGSNITVISAGISTVLGTGWTTGSAYYVAANGFLTEAVPGTGLIKQIGLALSSNSMLIAPSTHIIQA